MIEDNLRLLDQGLRFLAVVEDDTFAKAEPLVASSGMGSHFRHVIDYYDRFLDGLDSGSLDYDLRERDVETETHTHAARARLEGVMQRLRALTELEATPSLSVKMDSREVDAAAPRSQSSIERELQFLMSHTVHHYALIAVILRLNGGTPPEDFGVAPSTLRHWKESRACAP